MPDHSASETPAPPFIELQSVDSTNNYARQLITGGLATDGAVIFAHEQLAGKGQRGRHWASEKGSNILQSILINPQPLKLSEQFHLSAMVAVILRDFFSKLAGEDTKIKWPNDLYWQDRKAGGVLIESVVGNPESGVRSPESRVQSRESINSEIQEKQNSYWKWSIIGVGININQSKFDPDLKNPVSLKQITGKDFEVITLAKEFSKELLKNFECLIKEGSDVFLEKYNSVLYKKDQLVKFRKDNRVFEAIVKSVDSTGKLHIKHKFEEEINFGELEWVT